MILKRNSLALLCIFFFFNCGSDDRGNVSNVDGGGNSNSGTNLNLNKDGGTDSGVGEGVDSGTNSNTSENKDSGTENNTDSSADSSDDDAGSEVDGGTNLEGPLSLEITDVVTSTYEDCIEPTLASPDSFTPSNELYFEAKTGSDTTPPTDWTLGIDCSAGDTGLECTGEDDTILTYTGTGFIAVVSFDVVHTSSDTIFINEDFDENYHEYVNTIPQRLTFIVSILPDSRLTHYGSSETLTISNLNITPLPSPASTTIENNSRTIFTITEPITVDDSFLVTEASYLASFEIDTDGDYNIGYLCTRSEDNGTSCQSDPQCSLYDATGTHLSNLQYEWDPSVDPSDQNEPFYETNRIRNVTYPSSLTVGTYHVLCENPGRIFVRTYDDDLVRSCNYLTWYFSLRQGGDAVTGLELSSIKPTVDGRDLGVEAGAKLTQNNTSRVALLLDRSFSITQAEATSSVQEAAKAFVDAMPDGTYYQVHQFASEETVPMTILGNPNSDTDAVKESLDQYDPWPVSNSAGFTKLFDAIGLTTTKGYNQKSGEFQPPNFDYLQKVMIVFTDGDDTASTIFVDQNGDPSADRVKHQLQICRINALSVGLGSGIRKGTLLSLTGNNFFMAADNESLLATFEAVADDLNSRYRFKMVTPQPVVISDSSSLRIDFNNESAVSIYEPPIETCEPPTVPSSFP